MRELTEQEANQVVGGDGIVIPGGGYISTTRTVFNGFGVAGALSAAYTVGTAIGAGINYGYAHMTDSNIGSDLYDWRQSS